MALTHRINKQQSEKPVFFFAIKLKTGLAQHFGIANLGGLACTTIKEFYKFEEKKYI